MRRSSCSLDGPLGKSKVPCKEISIFWQILHQKVLIWVTNMKTHQIRTISANPHIMQHRKQQINIQNNFVFNAKFQIHNSITVHCGALWYHDSIYSAHYELEKPNKTNTCILRSKIWQNNNIHRTASSLMAWMSKSDIIISTIMRLPPLFIV